MRPFSTRTRTLHNRWNGVGLFHEDLGDGFGDRAFQINYTLMGFGPASARTPRLLDPEYMGTRPLESGKIATFNPVNTRTYVGKNAGYSYADLKDFFLAAYDPATGEVPCRRSTATG